jgi:hypothetical protein
MTEPLHKGSKEVRFEQFIPSDKGCLVCEIADDEINEDEKGTRASPDLFLN